MEERRKRGSLIGPAILIICGIVLLLNNLGMTSLNIWDLLRLWPILLIAAGLDILIGRRSAVGAGGVLIAMLVLLAGGLWLLASWSPAGELEGEEISESLGDAKLAEVEIGHGVGRLFIDALPESDALIEGTVQVRQGEKVEKDFRITRGTAHFTLKSKGAQTPMFLGSWDDESTWDLSLNRDVPMRLKVGIGVGTASIDLRQLSLTELDVNPGVGKTTVILPEKGRLEADIDGGVGQVIVQVPKGMAVRVHVSPGLGSKDVPESYRREGDAYVSPGYDKAENRVELKASVGVGQVTIQEYKGE